MRTTPESCRTIGIECESLEGDHGGVARLTRKLIQQLALREDARGRWKFKLYFKGAVPEDIRHLDPSLFAIRRIGVPSFSLYYYLFLPLRLWWDRPYAMFWPNYMLPIIHPPFVRSLVMLTEDIFREAHNPKLPFRYRLAYRIFATGWAAHRADRILAISESSRKELIAQGIDDARIVVNRLGVDRTQGTTPETGEYILFVAQAFPRRHLKETMEAFEQLARERPDLRLEIIGTDKYEPPIVGGMVRDMNRRLDRPAISWRQHVSDADLASAYAGAQTVVYVSDAEAFGLPPLEALSYGVPAVVADAPINREIYGEHAFYANDATANGIARAIARSLDDGGHRQRIEAAAPGILERFTWKGFANRFMHLVEQW